MKKDKERFPARVQHYMDQLNMAPRGSRILLGVSGGADSVCLLHVLDRLAAANDWALAVVHVNHRIRREAGEDAVFVRKLCEQLEIPFFLREADVESLAKEWGMSTEEAGRRVRYQAFEETAAVFEADRIAVAHNRNDRAETLLFHLFRGTGLAGMASIRPIRDQIIRPLLETGREEIEAWLAAEGIPFCTDQTNHTDDYTRNRIRRHVLPYVRTEICAEADVHLAQEAELLEQTSDFVARMTDEAFARCANVFGGNPADRKLCAAETGNWEAEQTQEEAAEYGVSFGIEEFLREDPFLQSHMILLALKKVTGGGKDIGMQHVRDVQSLFMGISGRRIMLPYRAEAVRSFGEVLIIRERTEKGLLLQKIGVIDLKSQLDAAGTAQILLPGIGMMEYSLETWEKSQVIPEKRYTKWLDYDKIESLVLRTRQPGDYLTVNDLLQKKSLKEYLIQEKIPASQRAVLPLLADGNHILWVVGHRISSAVKVGESTRRLLRVSMRPAKTEEKL